jgi:predicted Fe-Mo cluster-binding NifX family protein
MQICIPVIENNGLQSRTSDHFGSAPFFMIVDTDSRACRALANRNEHHAHGACQPLVALAGERVDGLVVKGIGRGALARLQGSNIQVLLCDAPTVEGTLAALGAGRVSPVTPDMACGGHGHGHAHQHQHGYQGTH